MAAALPPAARQQARWAWSAMLLIGCADAELLLGSDFHLLLRPELKVMVGVAALGLVWWIYATVRHEPRLADLGRNALMLVVYTNVAAVFSYLLVGTTHLPLHDARLSAIDRAMGFDWMAAYRWWKASPYWGLSRVIYLSLGAEFLAVLLALSALGHSRRAWELNFAFMLSSLAVVALGVCLPAAGAYVQYQVPEAASTLYVQHYLGLRDGTIRLIDPCALQGLVQFPSFHAALAALCSYMLYGLRWPFVLSVIWNVLIVAVTPVFGGHYLTDVITGLLLAAVIMLCLNRWRRLGSGLIAC